MCRGGKVLNYLHNTKHLRALFLLTQRLQRAKRGKIDSGLDSQQYKTDIASQVLYTSSTSTLLGKSKSPAVQAWDVFNGRRNTAFLLPARDP